MNEHQQNFRIAAAKAFIESLDQLQTIGALEHQPTESECQPEGSVSSTNSTQAKIWDEVAADLDAFFGDTQSSQAGIWGEES
ncbi:MAG TPA: hypothetical protein V6D11_04615 [Waterburya sp.]